MFGLLFVSLAFSAPLTWWGSSNPWAVLLFGAIISARFKRFPLLFAYAAPFALLMGAYALLNHLPVGPHIMFLNFYFMVFMLVEPKTAPLRPRGRIVYGALAALATFAYFHLLPQFGDSVLGLATTDLFVPVLNHWDRRKR